MKNITMVLLGLIITGVSFNPALAAGDAAAGKAKAALCAACHGPDGNSSDEQYPDLAGQKEHYLVEQIKAYRDGGRENPLMTPMAAGLSDGDIDNLAAFFAAQTPK